MLTLEISVDQSSPQIKSNELLITGSKKKPSTSNNLSLYLNFYIPQEEPIFNLKLKNLSKSLPKTNSNSMINSSNSKSTLNSPLQQQTFSPTNISKTNTDTFRIRLADSRCPFCFVRIEHFRSMMCHLNLCHHRLVFEQEGLASDGVPVISVGLCAESQTEISSFEGSEFQARETAHLGYSSACLKASFRENDMNFYLHANRQARYLRKSQVGKWDLEALQLYDNKPNIKRTYYHSRTLR